MILSVWIFAATMAVVSNPQPQYSIDKTVPTLIDSDTGFLLSNTSFNHGLINISNLRGKRNCLGSSKANPLLYLCCLVVAQSGDTHPNPGPRAPRFPCGCCKKAVRNCHEAILCDDCDTWFHKNCIGMSSAIYDQLACHTNNFSWICCSCGMPNFSTSLFDTEFSHISTFNYFSNPDTTRGSDIGSPIAASSPKTSRSSRLPKFAKRPLKSLIINCQSLRSQNKQGELHSILDNTKPDIVFGTESWLDHNILSSEVFPENFTVYRRDRVGDSHGGVFLLVSNSLISSEETSLEVDDAELVWAKVCMAGSKDLLLGSFYRPPSSDGTYLEKT